MYRFIKLKVQIFSRFLSNMIMPNISIFITLGIFTSFFSSSGWFPNQELSHLISPIITYLLPLSISYTGGYLISRERGGLAGSISVIGVIMSTNMPMLLGAMIIGPISGWTIKIFDQLTQKNIRSGFEMLVNNFSLAFISVFLSIFSFFIIGPLVQFISQNISSIIKVIISYQLLPFISIIIEPAKVFFLNNVINHGILSPLGIQEIINNHSSIFFLIESNPGPGLGVLMAWYFFGIGTFSKTAGGAALIEFFGGVHEVYFPYVLKKPKLIFALVFGGMIGIFLLIMLHGGLMSAVSPGSFLSILAMTPKNMYFINIISIFVSFFVSFIIASILLKFESKKDKKNNINIINNKNLQSIVMNDNNCFQNIQFQNIKNIIVACDAGMGSSAIGASLLRKKIDMANLKYISVSNLAIHLLPKNADLVITHHHLTERAKNYSPHSQHISLKTFIDHHFYDNLINELIKTKLVLENQKEKNTTFKVNKKDNFFKISEKNIFLNQHASNKEEAIQLVGKYLVEQGYVNLDYINAMLDREKLSSTWLGESIAIPHGTIESKNSILKTGIIFCQFPDGVHFGDDIDDIAYIVIGIAAKNDEHIMVVSSITHALDNKEVIKKLSNTQNIQEVLSFLNVKKFNNN